MAQSQTWTQIWHQQTWNHQMLDVLPVCYISQLWLHQMLINCPNAFTLKLSSEFVILCYTHHWGLHKTVYCAVQICEIADTSPVNSMVIYHLCHSVLTTNCGFRVLYSHDEWWHCPQHTAGRERYHTDDSVMTCFLRCRMQSSMTPVNASFTILCGIQP